MPPPNIGCPAAHVTCGVHVSAHAAAQHRVPLRRATATVKGLEHLSKSAVVAAAVVIGLASAGVVRPGWAHDATAAAELRSTVFECCDIQLRSCSLGLGVCRLKTAEAATHATHAAHAAAVTCAVHVSAHAAAQHRVPLRR